MKHFLRTVRPSHFRQAGFSLAEIILATTLLGLVLVMMFNLYPTSLITIRHAEHRLTASSRAQHLLEYERSLSFTTLQKAVGTTQEDVTPTPSDLPADDFVCYKSDLTISNANPCEAPANLVKLQVVEWWNERGDCTKCYHKWHNITSEVEVVNIKQ